MRQKGFVFLNWFSLDVMVYAISVFFVNVKGVIPWRDRDEHVPVGNGVAQIRVAPPLTFIRRLRTRSDFNNLLTDQLHQVGHNYSVFPLFVAVPPGIIKTKQIVLLLHLK